jgi:hypothetical protein
MRLSNLDGGFDEAAFSGVVCTHVCSPWHLQKMLEPALAKQQRNNDPMSYYTYFYWLNASTFILILMWNNVSVPISHVANRNPHSLPQVLSAE